MLRDDEYDDVEAWWHEPVFVLLLFVTAVFLLSVLWHSVF